MNENFLLEKIQKETDINNLKTLFIKTINQYETQLTEIHNVHANQIDLLNQQLSESNAAIAGLNKKNQKMQEINDSDLDMLRDNEKHLQSLLQKTQKENSELRSKIKNFENPNISQDKTQFLAIQEKNAKLVEQLARCKEDYADLFDSFQFVREALMTLSKSTRNLRSIVVSFIENTNKSLGLAHHASKNACQYAQAAENKYQNICEGLKNIKRQLHTLKTTSIPIVQTLNFNSMKSRLSRKFNQILAVELSKQHSNYSMRERRINGNTELCAETALKILGTLRFLNISANSSFTLFSKFFINNLHELKRVCTHFVSIFQINLDSKQLKYQKKLKDKEIEIRNLKTENSLMKTSHDLTLQKLKDMKESSTISTIRRNQSKNIKKSQISSNKDSPHSLNKTTDSATVVNSIISDSNKSQYVDVETQSGLINMALIRDRTIRHSKEAELSVVQSKLNRAEEQNQKLISQIGGLRKIIKRAGVSASEETGKTRQTIEDLETQLREEKRNVQRKTTAYLKLQRDNEELAQVAAKVDPLKKTIALLFKNCSDRLIPLLDEQNISEELIELDELSQEIFNVPIHKICGPTYSRGFLKKQERKLNSAIANSIEVDEITQVFDSMISELQKLCQDSKLSK